MTNNNENISPQMFDVSTVFEILLIRVFFIRDFVIEIEFGEGMKRDFLEILLNI
jgi:hypothetical protein